MSRGYDQPTWCAEWDRRQEEELREEEDTPAVPDDETLDLWQEAA